jgi:hypothetical protein
LRKSKLILKRLDITSTMCDLQSLMLLFEAQTQIQFLGIGKIPKASLELFEFIVQTLSLIQISFKKLELSYYQLYNIICSGFSEIQLFDFVDCVLIGTPAVKPVCTTSDSGTTFVENIVMGHPEIQTLCVTNIDICFNVDNLTSVFEGHLVFSMLTTLKIEQVGQRDILMKLSEKVRTLTSLSLNHCWHVTDMNLRTLLKANKGLKEFKTQFSRDLTDGIMHTLMYNCKKLRSFTMHGCNTTYSGLVKMVKRLHFLTSIDFDCIDDFDEVHEFSIDEVISIGNVVNYVRMYLQNEIIDLTQSD